MEKTYPDTSAIWDCHVGLPSFSRDLGVVMRNRGVLVPGQSYSSPVERMGIVKPVRPWSPTNHHGPRMFSSSFSSIYTWNRVDLSFEHRTMFTGLITLHM